MLCDVRAAPVVVAVGHRLRQALDRERAPLRGPPDALLCLLSFARSSLVSFPVPSESTARLNDDTLVVIWKMSP